MVSIAYVPIRLQEPKYLLRGASKATAMNRIRTACPGRKTFLVPTSTTIKVSMDTAFTLFPKLPPEIRVAIWDVAAEQAWSLSTVAGNLNSGVSQTCRESRVVAQCKCVRIESLGYINFERHIFIFRGPNHEAADHELFLRRHNVFEQMQYICVHPAGKWSLFEIARFVKLRCPSLKALIVIAPWPMPPPPEDVNEVLDIAAGDPGNWGNMSTLPAEDWGAAFNRSPTEIDINSLLDALDQGPAANEARNAEYEALLHPTAQMLFVQNQWNLYLQILMTLRRLRNEMKKISSERPPTIYLRSPEQNTKEAKLFGDCFPN
jgi:hypothetical protein